MDRIGLQPDRLADRSTEPNVQGEGAQVTLELAIRVSIAWLLALCLARELGAVDTAPMRALRMVLWVVLLVLLAWWLLRPSLGVRHG
jgi:hypothetical protein